MAFGSYITSLSNTYVVAFRPSDRFFLKSDDTYEAYNSSNYLDYVRAGSQIGATQIWTWEKGADAAPTYLNVVVLQASGTPASTATPADTPVSAGPEYWDGSNFVGAGNVQLASVAGGDEFTLGKLVDLVTDYGDGVLDASLTGSVASVSGSVGSVAAGVSVGSIAANAITANSIATGAIDRDALAADTGLQTIRSGTCQAGSTASTVVLDASASAVTDFYVGQVVYITGGTGVGQTRAVTAYNGTTKTATVSPDWKTTPVNTSTFAVLPAGPTAAPTAAQNAAAWGTRVVGTDPQFGPVTADQLLSGEYLANWTQDSTGTTLVLKTIAGADSQTITLGRLDNEIGPVGGGTGA